MTALFSISGEPRAAPVTPISGLHELVSDRTLRYLVVGEVHGTREIPLFFADVVKQAQSVRSVTVALELPQSEAGAIDRYMASAGGVEDRNALLASDYWRAKPDDGRRGVAMIELIERFRRSRLQGTPVRLALCQPNPRSAPALYEEDMAACWRKAGQGDSKTLVAILVGNAHASRQPVFGYRPAASWLPVSESLAFDVVSVSGAAWNCDDQGCGVRGTGAEEKTYSRGFHRGVSREGGLGAYDGLYSVGDYFTPSQPAA